MLGVLADGEWHRIGDFADFIFKVKPEAAVRAFHQMYSRTDDISHIPTSYKLDRGRRRYVERRLLRLKQTGKIEIRGRNLKAEFRMRSDARPDSDVHQ